MVKGVMLSRAGFALRTGYISDKGHDAVLGHGMHTGLVLQLFLPQSLEFCRAHEKRATQLSMDEPEKKSLIIL